MIINLEILENLLIVTANRKEQLNILEELLNKEAVHYTYIDSVKFITRKIESFNDENYFKYYSDIEERREYEK